MAAEQTKREGNFLNLFSTQMLNRSTSARLPITPIYANKMYAQMKLSNSYRIRLSDDDLLLLKELKKLRVKPTTFMRKAFREKIERDLPKLIAQEKINENKKYCPF